MRNKREYTLKYDLEKAFGKGNFKKPNENDFASSQYNGEIHKIFKTLGGVLPQYPVGFKGYDISLKNFIVELDEERHFNRYRSLTLSSNIYKYLDFQIENYKNYCEIHEKDCLKAANWGRNWTSPSSEKQYGISSYPGDFDKNGASRWKQRAFNDYLRDVGQLISNIPLMRISIWEKVGNYLINDLIIQNKFEPIVSLINSRI